MTCYQNGVQSSCGQAGSCNPAPDCLVEFWTGYGYTGARDCYGTKADVDLALANPNGAPLVVNQVSHNDQYSSFRTIEQICQDRGIDPCHLAGVPNKIKTGVTQVYKDANRSGKWKQFSEAVNGDSDFDDNTWYGSWIQGDVDDKISSFSMDFSVAPTCYKAVGGPNCLCIDGGASLLPIECTDAKLGEGWTKVSAAKNVWVLFSPDAYSPALLGHKAGSTTVQLYLKDYYLTYPGTPGSGFGIEWHYLANAPLLWFDYSVPGAF
jgi:hypothetical protein